MFFALIWAADIKHFHILSESGIGSGVRRIEAITGELVVKYANELATEVATTISNVKADIENKKVSNTKPLEDLLVKVERLVPTYAEGIANLSTELNEAINSVEVLKKELKAAKADQNKGLAEELINNVQVVDGINRLDVELEDVDMKMVRTLSDDLINRIGSGILTIQAIEGAKVSVIVKVSEDLAKENPASGILKAIIEPFNGRGGGKPTMAQGGYNK